MLWRCLLSGLLVLSAIDVASADDGASDVDQAELASMDRAGGDDSEYEPARVCASLYEHINYGGTYLGVPEGSKEYLGAFWNDRVSSIDLEPGCEIWVYEHAWYGGSWAYFNSDVGWLDTWNDIISSYRCYCAQLSE